MTPNPKADAHQRMSEVARGLAGKLGAINAAGVLIGAAVTVLEAEGGSALVARYCGRWRMKWSGAQNGTLLRRPPAPSAG